MCILDNWLYPNTFHLGAGLSFWKIQPKLNLPLFCHSRKTFTCWLTTVSWNFDSIFMLFFPSLFLRWARWSYWQVWPSYKGICIYMCACTCEARQEAKLKLSILQCNSLINTVFLYEREQENLFTTSTAELVSRGAISILMVGQSRIRLRWQCKRYLRKDFRAMMEGKSVSGKQVTPVKVPWWSGRFSGSAGDRATCSGTCFQHPQPQKLLVSCSGMLLVLWCRCLPEGRVGAPNWLQQNHPGLWQRKVLPWMPCTEIQALIWSLTCHTLFYRNIK